MEVIVAFLRLYPQIWLHEQSPCFRYETQTRPSLPRRMVEVILSHGCMDVKRIFLPYGKILWAYENRVRKTYLQRHGTEYGERRIIPLLVICT